MALLATKTVLNIPIAIGHSDVMPNNQCFDKKLFHVNFHKVKHINFLLLLYRASISG
jgi:hypothetical protein